MPNSDATWGIEIGQCALKAVRCEYQAGSLVATDFDVAEYPKILSQSDADRDLLIRQAVEQLLSRHTLRGERVALVVPRQLALVRCLKLPPVQPTQIPKIIEHEARQQIPMPLDEVVWDYHIWNDSQPDSSGAREATLVAVKREAVRELLRPLLEAGIEIECVQVPPLALVNFAVFDQIDDSPGAGSRMPADPLLILALGTDASDIVITNGRFLWCRSISLGGNHLTQAISRGLNLTFAQAEQMKRHASRAEDPRALFLAMRPAMQDLAGELRRSVGYFDTLHPTRRVSRAIGLGNAFKLPGLERFLSKDLGVRLERVDRFRRLGGERVVESPRFAENVPSMGVCVGLCVQSLCGEAIRTNLLPPESRRRRLSKLGRAGATTVRSAAEHVFAGTGRGFPFDILAVCALVALNLGLLVWKVSGRRQVELPVVPPAAETRSGPAVGETVRLSGRLRMVAGHEGELHLVGDGFEAMTTHLEFGRELAGYRWAPQGEEADLVVVTGVRLSDGMAGYRLLPGVPLIDLRSIEKASDASSRAEVGRALPVMDPTHPAARDPLCWLAWAVPAVGEQCSFPAVVRAVYRDRVVAAALTATANDQAHAVLRGGAPGLVRPGDGIFVTGTVARDATPGRLVVLVSEIRVVAGGTGEGPAAGNADAQGTEPYAGLPQEVYDDPESHLWREVRLVGEYAGIAGNVPHQRAIVLQRCPGPLATIAIRLPVECDGDALVQTLAHGSELIVRAAVSGGSHGNAELMLTRLARVGDEDTPLQQFSLDVARAQPGVLLARISRNRLGSLHSMDYKGGLAAVADGGGPATVWDVTTQREVFATPQQPEGATCVALNSNLLAVGYASGACRVYDVAQGSLVYEQTDLPGNAVQLISWDPLPDGVENLFAAGNVGAVWIMQPGPDAIATVLQLDGSVSAAGWLSGGELLAICDGPQATLWRGPIGPSEVLGADFDSQAPGDMPDAELALALPARIAAASCHPIRACVALAAGSQAVVTGVGSLGAAEPKYVLRTFDGLEVNDVCWDGWGRRLAVASGTGVQIWDEWGTPLLWLPMAGQPVRVRLSESGESLVVLWANGSVRHYGLGTFLEPMGPPQQPWGVAAGEQEDPPGFEPPGVAAGPRRRGGPMQGEPPAELPGDALGGDGTMGPSLPGQLPESALPMGPEGDPVFEAETLLQQGELFAEVGQWDDLHSIVMQLDNMELDNQQQRRAKALRERLRKAANSAVAQARRLVSRARRNAEIWSQCVSLLQQAQAWDPDGAEGRAYQAADKLLEQLYQYVPDS